MKNDPVRASVLSAKIIPNADAALLKSLKLPASCRSLGLLTTDSDDVGYTALDEATKKAAVRVAWARSLYAGASNASTRLAGEFIGVLAAENPEEIRSGLDAASLCIENDACFYSADDADSIPYFAHCISRTGTYLSKQAKIAEGEPLAYLIAPPAEALYALDAALKAAAVELKVFYGPPTETNFAGALLTGEQSACKAACEAFAQAVCHMAENPKG